MAVLKIAQMGNPILRRVADPVSKQELSSERIQRLMDDMIETMREYEGVGLAAPQVHVPRQIIVIEARTKARYPSEPEFGLQVLVNPVIIDRSAGRLRGWEGCLSIEGIRGIVPRHEQVTVEALDRTGKPIKLSIGDFPSVIAQHEIDHLQGILFIDRMEDMRTLSFMREYTRYWLGAGDEEDEEEESAAGEER